MIKFNFTEDVRVSQGDILRNIEYYESVEEKDGLLTVSKIVFPYVVVLSQDCDLQWDNRIRDNGAKNEDKKLISMIVVPIYNADHFFAGEHLLNINLKMRPIRRKRTEGNSICNNTNPRYHYLEFGDDIEIPDSIMDFKHYFTINIDKVKKDIHSYRVATISELFREQISHRFSHYLSRIGLPEIE